MRFRKQRIGRGYNDFGNGKRRVDLGFQDVRDKTVREQEISKSCLHLG